MSAADTEGPVLVIGPSWVGDMIMAQSLFMTLRQARPDRCIDVIAPGWSLPLLDRMPDVRRGIILPVAHGELALGRRWRIGRSLCGEGYGQAIVLPRSLKAALPAFARDFTPLSDMRASAGYRLEVAGNLLRRYFTEMQGTPTDAREVRALASPNPCRTIRPSCM